MNKENYKIHIIGAGISGLIAAKTLEENGYCPTIIELKDKVGGRVQTNDVSGFQLDEGFQVLLTAYPEAKRHLDLEKLNLQRFLPGATLFNNGNQKTIGDPLRAMSLLFPTLFSGVGNFSDKLKILKLNTYLKKKSIIEIFNKKEQTTYDYLRDFGFSTDMIESFFRPFFSGIFLEDKLATSSRMFEFIYKMFGEGSAALPKQGIQAIPNQLKTKLTTTKFIFNTEVSSIINNEITLKNSQKIQTDYIIVTSGTNKLLYEKNRPSTKWKSCHTIYYSCKNRKIDKPLIGLSIHKDSLINNIFYHTSIANKNETNNELLSVTVVNDKGLENASLLERVIIELKEIFDITPIKLIKHIHIPMALPDLKNIKYKLQPMDSQLNDNIFVAGDTLLNGSLNAAMLSGESAANDLISTIKKI